MIYDNYSWAFYFSYFEGMKMLNFPPGDQKTHRGEYKQDYDGAYFTAAVFSVTILAVIIL